MSKVRVHPESDVREATSGSVVDTIEEVSSAIERRAFELFEKRGREPGRELEDWLEAEKELFFIPPAEISESAKGFRMTISAPGFDASDIEVIAMPLELLVEAKAERRLEPRRDNMTAGSLEFKTLYRRFNLTSPIETDQVTARMDEGSLTIEAPKKAVVTMPVRAAAA